MVNVGKYTSPMGPMGMMNYAGNSSKVEDFMDTQEGFTPTEVRLQADSRYMYIEKCVYLLKYHWTHIYYILNIYDSMIYI